MKIIVLGYMASGKSTVGRIFADENKLPFLDLDHYIEEKEGMQVKTIFKEKGEIYFRKKEHEYLKEILNSDQDFVLSLGGGTPCYANNMQSIASAGVDAVYLQASIPTLFERLIKEKANRPLIAPLNDAQITEYIAKHLFERRPFYEMAKFTLKIDGKSIAEVVADLKTILL